MPYLSIIRVKGDPDRLLARKRELIDPVVERLAPEHGGITHAAAKTDDGMIVVNVWETREGSEEIARHPDVQAAREQAAGDVTAPPEFEHYELADWRVPGLPAG